MTNKLLPALLLPAALAWGCAVDSLEGETTKSEDGKADASSVALFLDFEFDGEMLASSSYNVNGKIEDQLLYTIGQLNGDNSLGRLDKLVLSDVHTDTVDGKTHVRYHAKMPVAWGDKENPVDSYTLQLPRDMSYEGVSAFTEKYKHDCVDYGAHDVTTGSMWYYYRPKMSHCALADGDVYRIEATATISDTNTTGKFPEYDKVWEDGSFRVVAVFGKYEDGETSDTDAGIAGYNTFVTSMKGELSNRGLVTVPASVPSKPGVGTPEITFTATLDTGKTVEVVAILVDNVRTAGAAFDARYAELSQRADLIVYNGHAGLGANIRALANKGRWVAGQYVVVFMNGCDTHAYVDSSLADAHMAVNSDDTTGTKYMDIVTNAMPSFFRSMAGATMSLVRGLIRYDEPQTYEQIFRNIDRSQVVLVSGEEDNVYVPGGGGGEVVDGWPGLDESGTVARNVERRFETPTLPAGTYAFELTGTQDADLYVRIGNAPTTSLFDCRPYKTGSNERCQVSLDAPNTVHVMVRGWAASSDWELVGSKN